jgi:hypothetical protein
VKKEVPNAIIVLEVHVPGDVAQDSIRHSASV